MEIRNAKRYEIAEATRLGQEKRRRTGKERNEPQDARPAPTGRSLISNIFRLFQRPSPTEIPS